MRQRTFIILLTLAVLMTSGGYLWSQLRARVELVVVPVSVRDAEGKLVTGLTKDDFVVKEDGVPQSIANFSIEPAPLSAAIIVDDGMGGNSLKRLIPLLDQMTAGFAPEDEMVAYRYDHFVWKLTNFTNDHNVIVKSFGELGKIADTRPADGEPGEPLHATLPWLHVTIGSNGAPVPVPSAADRPKAPPTSKVLNNAVMEAADLLKPRPDPKRKIIMLISDGQVNGAGNTQPLEKTIDFLLQNRMQVYCVATDWALREGSFGLLSIYANATGGDVYPGGNAKDMEYAFSKITEQARNQYVLSYVSTNEPRGLQGVRREIAIDTRHPNQKVTHRKSYIQYPVR